MKVYNLLTTVNHSLAIIDVKDGSGRIFDYFILNEGDGRFLDFTRPVAIAQSGYTPSNITGTDFINASIGIPVFSARFKEQMEEELRNDLQFVECTVKCQNQDFVFYMGKITTFVDLVDRDRSAYYTLTDGTRELTEAVYLEEFEQPFLIARDKEDSSRSVVSETFKKLVEDKNLRINFIPAV